MAVPVLLPRQGQSVESCIITKWHKKVGDPVTAGEILFSYETDKAAFEEESPADGTVLAIFFEEGEDVPVLLNVAVLGNTGESYEEFRPAEAGGDQETNGAEANTTPDSQAVARAAEVAPTYQSTSTPQGGLLFASPRAKAMAERMHVNIQSATPSGPNGRILERDVLAVDRFAPVPIAATESPNTKGKDNTSTYKPIYEDIPFSGVRKSIAKNMYHSLQSMAQLTHHGSFDASEILAYRKAAKASQDKLGLPNITLNDIVLYAVSRTLLDHPDVNAHFLQEEGVLRRFGSASLGMAVDTPRGLLVPTLANASDLSLSEISRQAKDLAAEAQSGSLSPDKMEGASFTVSNLGNLGIEMFTPVINPPQVAILGVCTIIERARTSKDGNLELYPAMGLSLTYDHRAIDGAPASRFLWDLGRNLENFSLLLAR